MDEKRQYRRIDFRNTIQYRSVKDDIFGGCLGYDLSEGGVRFRANGFIPLSTEVTLHVQLSIEHILGFDGRVVWIQKNPHAETYQVGVEFMDSSSYAQNRKHLYQFIESHQS